jgi:hypothetical protein
MNNGVNIAARNTDIGKLAVAHAVELIVDAGTVAPRTKGIYKGKTIHLCISWIGFFVITGTLNPAASPWLWRAISWSVSSGVCG